MKMKKFLMITTSILLAKENKNCSSCWAFMIVDWKINETGRAGPTEAKPINTIKALKTSLSRSLLNSPDHFLSRNSLRLSVRRSAHVFFMNPSSSIFDFDSLRWVASHWSLWIHIRIAYLSGIEKLGFVCKFVDTSPRV